MLFACIILFIIHWKTKRNKDEDDANRYEPVPVNVNHYVEDPVPKERKPSIDEVDQWKYPISDLKTLQYSTVQDRPAYYEEIRVRRQPSHINYTNYNEPSWNRSPTTSGVVNPPQRGYYQPGTPVPVGYDGVPDQNRYSQYDNIPNQSRIYPGNYLRNSDLVEV